MLDTDTLLMKRALELARRGAGMVSPNPMVGAVLVNRGRVVGEGFHQYALLKHAEVNAIEQAGDLARGSTLYCNLEPCCHHGRTPPCTDALIEAGIARAVIAVMDPDRRVNGRGIQQLRDAGIEVDTGLLADRALKLNEAYFKFITRKIPFVHGVIEYSSDTGSDRTMWVPSENFIESVTQYDAVMIGGRPELGSLILNRAAERPRHRRLVVSVTPGAEHQISNLPARIVQELILVPFEHEDVSADGVRNVVSLESGLAPRVTRSQLAA